MDDANARTDASANAKANANADASAHADADARIAAGEKRAWLESHEEGYDKGLKPRQVQMIAIGGAIGTGLFLGAGARLQHAGPALAIVYLVCGIFSFFILRALGELVMHRPTSGSFVSYSREFLGERASFVAGWMYYLNWATTGIVDTTAVALYMKYWNVFSGVPQWVFAFIAMIIVGAMNMVAVGWFGEMEFWFSLIKVGALVLFLIIGVVMLISGHQVAGHATGFHLIADNGGIFPHGVLPAIVLVQGVVFAYAGIELVGTAAGEAQNVKTVLPRAINSVMWRIALFYVGSVVLLVLLLPWNAYKEGVSPFVTFFGSLGVPGIGSIMNIVVLTAALSSLNSGLYSTGRVLRSLAMGGSAPNFVSKMNAAKVPYGGILVTLFVYFCGVILNYFVPSQVFEIVLNVASLGIISTWAFIVVCQMVFRKAVQRGELQPVEFRMPFAPFSSWATLAFLLAVLILMGFDYPDGTFTIALIPIVAIALGLGWFVLKRSALFSPSAPSLLLTMLTDSDGREKIMPRVNPALAIHGGAGTVPAAGLNAANADAFHEGLRTALRAGWRVLAAGGAAVDAVTEAVKALEDDPLFNAGRGAVFTSAGTLEMDAAIMRGSDHAAGAVAGICGPHHPVEAARLIMERSGTVFMSGAGAENFLRAAGMTFMPPEYFATQWRQAALHSELTRQAQNAPDLRSDADRHGTVGAVARDAGGTLAAATSTGGFTAKRPGRIGDAPVIGAGTYADNASCAVSTTGNGEIFIRYTAAAEIAARIRHAGQSLERAATEIITELASHGGDGGLVALPAEGPAVLVFNTSGMYRGHITDGTAHTAIHREAYRVAGI